MVTKEQLATLVKDSPLTVQVQMLISRELNQVHRPVSSALKMLLLFYFDVSSSSQ
jgi:hypothetical protein